MSSGEFNEENVNHHEALEQKLDKILSVIGVDSGSPEDKADVIANIGFAFQSSLHMIEEVMVGIDDDGYADIRFNDILSLGTLVLSSVASASFFLDLSKNGAENIIEKAKRESLERIEKDRGVLH